MDLSNTLCRKLETIALSLFMHASFLRAPLIPSHAASKNLVRTELYMPPSTSGICHLSSIPSIHNSMKMIQVPFYLGIMYS
jgi:hypothetical protein